MRHIEQMLELAEAVSNGVIKGRTETAHGHDHRYKVAFIDNLSKFVGWTSEDGQGPHGHYISASVYDVVNSEQVKPREEDQVILDVNEANSPANILSILEFYNLTEITLVSSPSYPDEHVHGVTLRYAGANIDKMGRKIKASLFTEGLRKVGGSMEISE
jgi:hypothetical protein